jgi:hypothetical protein
MVTANVAQILIQEEQSGAVGEIKTPNRKPTTRPYKARMATKVKWALGDMMKESLGAQERMKRMWEWTEEARVIAETTTDTRVLLLLGKLDHEIGGLSINVAAIVQRLTEAIAESKPMKDEK